MKTEDIDGKRPSKWIPITDLKTLAALGKLAEEVNELGAIIARSIIQGLNGANPETGNINVDDLEKEIADVRGLSALVIRQLGLDEAAIAERAEKKRQMKRDWIDML
jgi:NTP pyrophosphatase (non-canonical NTP hydrolase)